MAASSALLKKKQQHQWIGGEIIHACALICVPSKAKIMSKRDIISWGLGYPF